MNKIFIIQQLIKGLISINTAMNKLNLSKRTTYRYKSKFIKIGPTSLIHGLTGKDSNNNFSKIDKYKPFALKKKYKDFGANLLDKALTV